VKFKALVSFIVVFSLSLGMLGCVGQAVPQAFSGVTCHNGVLYVGSMEGEVLAVNPTARSEELAFPSTVNSEWRCETITLPAAGASCGPSFQTAGIYGTPAVGEELLYIGTYGGDKGKIYALVKATGADRWLYPRGAGFIGAIVGGLVVDDDTVYVSSSDGRVYALDMTHGDSKWKSEPLADKLWTSPTIAGDTIYVSTYEGYLYALSAQDGSLLPWSFQAEAGLVSSPLVYEDTIFVGSFDRNLYAVEIGRDEPLWKFSAGNWFWATPLVNEDVVYAGCLDGKVYAINAETGEELWEFDAESPVVCSPVLVGDLLVVAAESGNVYVVNSNTGDGERIKNPEEDNKPSIDAPIRASFCAHEGMVYIRGQDNCLYAIDVNQKEIDWNFSLSME